MYTFNKKVLESAKSAYLRLITLGYRQLLRPFSRIARKLFEVKRIKRVYGVAMLSVMLSSTVAPGIFGLRGGGVVISAQAQGPVVVVEALTTEHSVRLPLEEYTVTQKYGFFHPGIDLAAPVGKPIYPVMDGTVVLAQRGRAGFGNHVMVDHGGGLQSLYAHMSTIAVTEKESINRFSPVGTVGSTGRSTGPHLHMQIWQNGGWVNPERFLEDYLENQIENEGKPADQKLAEK